MLNAVNLTFDALQKSWRPDKPVLEAAGREWAEGFSDHTPAEQVSNLQGRARLIEVAKAEEGDDAAPLIAKAVELVCEHRAQDPQRKIAILLRKTKIMARLIAEIRRACPDADVSGEGGNPLTDSRAVELILSLLTYLDHPGHTAARYHVLSSPVRAVFGFPETVSADARPDAEEWFALSAMRRNLMEQGLAGVFRAWIRAEAFMAQCSEYDRLRCEQLLELAREFDLRPPARFSQFVEHVRNRRMERQGGTAVRIMSIHASKGLEFETVLLMELDARQGNGGGEPVILEHEGTLQLVPSEKNADLLELSALHDEKVREEFMGELSVLYVGMTRARSFLDIVLRKGSSSHLAQLLRTGLKVEGQEVVETHEGMSVRECDAAQGRNIRTAPQDRGIAREPFAPPTFPATPSPRATYATPSSQEDAGLLSVSSILAPANRGAMKRGELIHAWLSHVSWIEDGMPGVADLLSATEELWSHLSHEQAMEEAGRLLAQIQNTASPLHRIFSKGDFAPEPGVELWRERRFAAMDATSRGTDLLTGCFDRAVIWRSADGMVQRAEIIDFKTDRFSNAAEQQQLEERYQPQLNAYRRALCCLLPGLKAGQVKVSLGFLGSTGK